MNSRPPGERSAWAGSRRALIGLSSSRVAIHRHLRQYAPPNRPANNWDFVLPNELCSGVLVQFALQPELRGIYSELLSPAGKEIVLCVTPRRTPHRLRCATALAAPQL